MKIHGVQTAALQASAGHRGFAFFMEQGLGKTGTAYLEFLDLVSQGLATRMVVFCPNSFKGGWVAEAEKWGFDVMPFVYESGADLQNNWFLNFKYQRPPVLIVNWESIRSPATQEYIRKFVGTKDVYAVADESIQISTFDAAQTKAALSMRNWFAWRRLLSGKPMKQGPHDLWSQMRFIGALNGQDYYSFKGAFCRMGGFKMKQVMAGQNEDILAERIDPYIFRATKAEWTDLPPKVPNIREYKLTPEMLKMYKQMEQEFVLFLEQGDVVTIEAAITKYIKLAQIQAGFIFDEDKKMHSLVDPAKNPRMALLKDLLANEVPGKTIVVYNHKPVRDQLEHELAKYNPVFIRGGMTTDEIEEAKRVFNGDRDCRIICITKSAKYGHTLLGDQTSPDHACADMVFYENTYSLDDRSQLEDRPHRHGQEQEFMRYWDLIGTPLDRNAVTALQRKEDIFQSVFSKLRSSVNGSASASSH